MNQGPVLGGFTDLFEAESMRILRPSLDCVDLDAFDSGGNPFPGDFAVRVKLAEALEVGRVKKVNIQLADGSSMNVWAFVPELAKFMKEAFRQNKRVLPYGERTSSGPLKKTAGIDEGEGVIGLTTLLIAEIDKIAELVDHKELDSGSLMVPMGVSVGHLNEFISIYENAEDNTQKKIFYDITTDKDSTLVANFITGGLGDNRRRLRVSGVLLIDYKGDIHYISDMEEIDALRGSQAAGLILGLNLELEEVPKVEEAVILPMQGNLEVLFSEKLPKVIASFWPEMYERNLEGDQVWMTGLEILSSTGARFVDNADSDWVKREWFSKGDDLLLIANTMTTNVDGVFASESGFGDSVCSLAAEGVIEEARTAVLKGAQAKQVKSLRKDIPLCARAHGNETRDGKRLRYSASVDDDVQIVLHEMDELLAFEKRDRAGEEIDATERSELDEFRKNLAEVVAAIMSPTVEAVMEATAQEIDHMLNGHLKMIVEQNAGTDEQIALDGGANPHTRFFGRPDQKEVISTLIESVREGHRNLNGKWFGAHIELRVNGEGEKHYTKHWEDRTQLPIMERRLAALAKYGGGANGTTSYRTPTHLWGLAPSEVYEKNGFVVSEKCPVLPVAEKAIAAK
ncbi:MAG: hypothetical protein ACI9QC_000950 [Oceanicoccus sp.]|jgi:hypothetical protein